MSQPTLKSLNEETQKAIGLPHVLSDLQVKCAGIFAQYSEQYAMYEIMKAKFITAKHEEGMSIASAENYWLVEENGQKWIFLKRYLAGLKEIIKATSNANYTSNNESRNLL